MRKKEGEGEQERTRERGKDRADESERRESDRKCKKLAQGDKESRDSGQGCHCREWRITERKRGMENARESKGERARERGRARERKGVNGSKK